MGQLFLATSLDMSYYSKFLKLLDSAQITPELAFEIIKYANLYDLQWAAHLLADVSVVQRVFPLRKRSLDILKLRQSSTTIEAIIDQRFDPSHPIHPQQVVVNLGGCYANPRYEEWAIQVFTIVAEALPAFHFYIVNSTLQNHTRFIQDNLVVKSASREEFIKLLNTTERVFSPPGLTFFLESSYLGNTTFLLPPQHPGQLKNESVIRDSLPTLPALTWQVGDPSIEGFVEHTLSQLASPENI